MQKGGQFDPINKSVGRTLIRILLCLEICNYFYNYTGKEIKTSLGYSFWNFFLQIKSLIQNLQVTNWLFKTLFLWFITTDFPFKKSVVDYQGVYKFWGSSVQFIPTYFILRDAIVNGIVFFILLWDCAYALKKVWKNEMGISAREVYWGGKDFFWISSAEEALKYVWAGILSAIVAKWVT